MGTSVSPCSTLQAEFRAQLAVKQRELDVRKVELAFQHRELADKGRELDALRRDFDARETTAAGWERYAGFAAREAELEAEFDPNSYCKNQAEQNAIVSRW
jgi:hypothetical protein